MPVGGNNAYPSIQTVDNLVRSLVDDDGAGATGTLGEGQIYPDNMSLSVTMGNFFNSALRTICRQLRTTSGPMLIRDNIQLIGVPVLQSPTLGLGASDPTVQVSIGFTGYFNGTINNAAFTLPADCLMMERVWERMNGSELPYGIMRQPAGGIPSQYQGLYNGVWEWRQDAVWMPGTIVPMDFRFRYFASLPTLYTSAINVATTYIPILDSENAIAGRIIQQIALRQPATVTPAALQWANDEVSDFLNEQIKRGQGIDYPITSYGDEKQEGWGYY